MSDSSFTDSERSEQSERSELSERSRASESSSEKALITVLKKEGCIIEGEFNLKNGFCGLHYKNY